ncbi:hypothetical protein [Rickettsia endosymbiont of Lasioglossum villosulum]
MIEEDVKWLKSRSGCDFNLRFMNKLLLKLTYNKPNNRLAQKKNC